MFGLLAPLTVGSPAAQTNYPEKPIRWVIPLAPGDGAELVGTTVANKLTEALKQPVVVECTRAQGDDRAGLHNCQQAQWIDTDQSLSSHF